MSEVKDSENIKTKVSTKLLLKANEQLKKRNRKSGLAEIQLVQAMAEDVKYVTAQDEQ